MGERSPSESDYQTIYVELEVWSPRNNPAKDKGLINKHVAEEDWKDNIITPAYSRGNLDYTNLSQKQTLKVICQDNGKMQNIEKLIVPING